MNEPAKTREPSRDERAIGMAIALHAEWMVCACCKAKEWEDDGVCPGWGIDERGLYGFVFCPDCKDRYPQDTILAKVDQNKDALPFRDLDDTTRLIGMDPVSVEELAMSREREKRFGF